MVIMFKWKDTARISKDITKKYANGETRTLIQNTLVIIERLEGTGLTLVYDTNPKKSFRMKYKLKQEDFVVEEYAITRDINIPMLLSDGWDAQELLRK
jgi:hypothetical protein